MKAEVIAIGDELTTGQRLDTNSQWISAELAAVGVTVHFHTTATDSLEDGIEAFARAAMRVDLVVATGGLGPTADDLTRDVLAAVSDRPLELSEEALRVVESRFARRGMPMPESNRLQAMFPRGSRIIANPEGTAPGIDLDVGGGGGGRCRIFALPGVPSEMKRMWRDTVAPAILSMHPEAGTMRFRRIKCFGAGESAIEAMLPDLVRRGRDPLVGITAHEATITLRIAARGRDEAECLAKIAPTERVIRDCLGPLVFGTEDDEIEDAAVAAVTSRGWSLATVESATAGLVASLCMQADGRGGGRYRGGRVLPAARAGDAAVADAARRCREEHVADVGLAIGPEADGPEPGRTRVAIAMATPSGVETVEHVLGGAGSLRLSRAAKTALDLVRRSLP